MIRLALIEDHPAIAEGLTALLRGEPDVPERDVHDEVPWDEPSEDD